MSYNNYLRRKTKLLKKHNTNPFFRATVYTILQFFKNCPFEEDILEAVELARYLYYDEKTKDIKKGLFEERRT